jgi:hypothetical protein
MSLDAQRVNACRLDIVRIAGLRGEAMEFLAAYQRFLSDWSKRMRTSPSCAGEVRAAE